MNIPDHVIEHEAAFADAHYQPWANQLDINPRMFEKYSKPKHNWDWRQKAARLLGSVEGLSLLDLGCGMGEESVYLAKLGARVTAIDISPVGIDITVKRALHNNLSERITVYRMFAHKTGFSSDSFDAIHGLGILHHIGLSVGLTEVLRLLKPGGKAVFLEPLGDSELLEKLKLWLYKEEYADMATEYEKPLTSAELHAWQGKMRTFQLYPYGLLYRLRNKWPVFARPVFQIIDYYTLKILPMLAHFAGGVVIYLEK